MGKQAMLESAMKRLEEIVALMDGDISIDDSIKLYTEAVKLIDFSEKKLSAAKLKVEKLTGQTEEQDEPV